MRIKKKELILEQRVKHKIPIPKEIKKLYKIFSDSGHQLYLVGGSVRDTLLNKPIKDYDLATDATPNKIERMLDKHGIKHLGVGESFGVINAFMNGEEFEIATFREEEDYTDGRRPDTVKFSTIEKDVMRRDLTINALFYDIGTGEIVDLVGGLDDIKNGIIRTVGSPEDRFGEDKLRKLRAIRFAARVGSQLDPAIDASLKKDNSLDGVSEERIRDEFIKGIKTAKSTKQFLSLIHRYDLFKSIFKGIEPINHNYVESKDIILVIAMLLKDVDFSTIGKKLNTIKYPANEIRPIQFLLSFYQTIEPDNFYTLKKLHDNTHSLEDSTFKEFGQLTGANINFINKFIAFKFSVTGDMIQKQYNIKPGPEMGNMIKTLETKAFYDSL